jgi:hypothetical protein
MKILKLCSFFTALLCSALSIHAQTADEIIAKHIEAIGGKEKLSAITSVRIESTVQIMGNDAPGSTVIVNGKGFRNESEFNGSKIIQVLTDKSGWAVNPMMGDDPQSLPDDQYKRGKDQIYIIPFLDYAARGGKAELLGQEKVGTINAYKIKLTSSDNAATTYYLDPASYYIIQTVKSAEVMGQQVDVITTYSDYKKSDYGWVTPQSTEVSFGSQFSLTMKEKKLEVNPAIDAAVFEMKK